MTFTEYLNLFSAILENPAPQEPYNDPEYYNYTKLNWTRLNRWLNHGTLNEETIAALQAINTVQHWIVITEPWCGDAAHIVPFIHLMASQNSNIRISYELRDAAPFRINNYLTNGGKSIPVLIVQDDNKNDLFVWGPRPKSCQEVFAGLKAEDASFEEIKTALQHWYNGNKGIEIQKEITLLLQMIPETSK